MGARPIQEGYPQSFTPFVPKGYVVCWFFIKVVEGNRVARRLDGGISGFPFARPHRSEQPSAAGL